MIKLPKEAQLIIEKLNQAGFSAYIVGGCVRDSLLGLKPLDWDICTSALPEETKRVFSSHHIIETGILHGTITVRINHKSFEITTFRTDGEYEDYRHPKAVEFVSDITEDLSRRDFTVNAMAYHPTMGLVDMFSGQEDLSRKIIRCVGEPTTRFQEDALRIMRGLRFAGVYGFSIEEKTKEAMFSCRELLTKIAAERISVELKKLLVSEFTEKILLEYRDIIATVVPEIAPMFDLEQKNPYHQYDVWKHTIYSVGYAEKNLIVRLAVLFHDIGKPQTFSVDKKGICHFYSHAALGETICETVLRRLKFDVKTINSVKELVKYHDAQIEPTEKAVKRWLQKIGEEQFERLLYVKEADAKTTFFSDEKLQVISEIRRVFQTVFEQNACFSLKDLNLSGTDLIALGLPEGKIIGETLSRLLELVMDNKIENTKESLLAYLKNE